MIEEMTFNELMIKDDQMRYYGADHMIKTFRYFSLYKICIRTGQIDRAQALFYWLNSNASEWLWGK